MFDLLILTLDVTWSGTLIVSVIMVVHRLSFSIHINSCCTMHCLYFSMKTVLFTLLTLAHLVRFGDAVTCHDYCSGNDDPTGQCQAKSDTTKTCEGDTCRVTHWRGAYTSL